MKTFRLRASIFIETYKSEESDICFFWGQEPAGIHKKAGNGKIFLIGTALGPSSTAYIDDESSMAIKQLLSLCGVSPAHEGKLLVQKRTGNGKEAWFITNPHENTVKERIFLPKGGKAHDLLGYVLESDGKSFTLAVEPLDVRVVIVTG